MCTHISLVPFEECFEILLINYNIIIIDEFSFVDTEIQISELT